jgi:hypothetical protein
MGADHKDVALIIDNFQTLMLSFFQKRYPDIDYEMLIDKLESHHRADILSLLFESEIINYLPSFL